jgi:hypothetical protein
MCPEIEFNLGKPHRPRLGPALQYLAHLIFQIAGLSYDY